MSIEIHTDDLNKVTDLLASLAAYSPSGAWSFLKDLIQRANIPENWKTTILQTESLDARTLIEWAKSKGPNPDQAKCHTLGSILNIVLEETGDKEEIATFMVRYELYDINLLPKELLSKINIQDIIQQKPQYSIISKAAKDDLENILKAVKFSVLKKACRRSLPRLAHRHALSVSQIGEVFKLLLEEFQYRNDGVRRILEFAWRLREDHHVQGEQVHLKLDAWFKRHDFEAPSISDTDSADSEDIPEPAQPRLFIQVTPKHGESNQRGMSDQFSVQAWLIPNQAWLISDSDALKKDYAKHEYFYLDFSYLLFDYYDEIPQFISQSLWSKIQQLKREDSFQSEQVSKEVKCIQDFSFSKIELKELLELFLNESLLILWYEEEEVSQKIDSCELIIEIFLPSDLLCDCDIDQWSFRNIAEENSLGELGSSYRVLIRSLERSRWLQSTDDSNARSLRKNASKKKSWQRNWELAQSKLSKGEIPSELEFELLKHINDFDKTSLDVQLHQKMGVKLVQVTQRDEILRVIIDEKGIPIVLWTRCDDSKLDFTSELNELIHKEPLRNLPQSVLKTRKDAQRSGVKNHLGCHLVLLWDDPNRFPPSSDNLKFSA